MCLYGTLCLVLMQPEPEVTGSHMTGTGSDVTGNHMTQTGSDVFSNGKPRSSRKNRSWAQEEAKPLRNAGSKSKVQLEQRGWSFSQRKGVFMLEKNILMWKKSNNPWTADDESSMSQGEAES